MGPINFAAASGNVEACRWLAAKGLDFAHRARAPGVGGTRLRWVDPKPHSFHSTPQNSQTHSQSIPAGTKPKYFPKVQMTPKNQGKYFKI